MVKQEKRHHVLWILAIGLLLSGLVITAGDSASPFGSAKITDINALGEFLLSLGYSTDLSYVTEQSTALPHEFDEVFISYNAIQIQQGCDLTRYAGKQVTVYTVPVVNYPQSTDTVYATVIVYKGKVIGGDLHSAVMDGFMLPLLQKS